MPDLTENWPGPEKAKQVTGEYAQSPSGDIVDPEATGAYQTGNQKKPAASLPGLSHLSPDM